MKIIDLVVCMYNEESMIDLFLSELRAVINLIPAYQIRIIFVNDGSTDGTLQRLLQARASDSRICVVNLSRNFGHEGALAAGLSAASGDAVIVMDGDLEDPPALIPQLIEKWELGFDVVNAKRSSRLEDPMLKRWTAKKFYQVINKLSGKIRIPENVGNFRLISRQVLDELRALPERNRVFRVLVPYLGFLTTEVEFVRPKRPAGQTHYNYSSMVRLALDGITSATNIPLRIASSVGFLISLSGFGYLIYVIWVQVFTNSGAPGWASLMAVVLFIGGVQTMFLGIIGEYLGRMFVESKLRPAFVIRETYLEQQQPPTGIAH